MSRANFVHNHLHAPRLRAGPSSSTRRNAPQHHGICLASPSQHTDPLLGQQGNAADSSGSQHWRSIPSGGVFFAEGDIDESSGRITSKR
jgi:hypothetical protein